MRIIFSFLLFFCVWLIPSAVFAQNSNAQQRTQEIVSLLSKTKYKFSAQRGVSKEKYKSVRSEPVTYKNTADYSGFYEVPNVDYNLAIKISPNGEIAAAGSEPKDGDVLQKRKFTFRNAKIDGALLTATKVYDDGSTEKFEGVFINQINIEGTSPTQIERQSTTFGLGVVDVRVKTASGLNLDKLFYQKK